MVRINLIKGQEIFVPESEAEPTQVGEPEREEDLRVLDHLLRKNQEGKRELGEALLRLGFSNSEVERILHPEADGEHGGPRESTPAREQSHFAWQGGLCEEISVSCFKS